MGQDSRGHNFVVTVITTNLWFDVCTKHKKHGKIYYYEPTAFLKRKYKE